VPGEGYFDVARQGSAAGVLKYDLGEDWIYLDDGDGKDAARLNRDGGFNLAAVQPEVVKAELKALIRSGRVIDISDGAVAMGDDEDQLARGDVRWFDAFCKLVLEPEGIVLTERPLPPYVGGPEEPGSSEPSAHPAPSRQIPPERRRLG
jgi:hypothetical protein